MSVRSQLARYQRDELVVAAGAGGLVMTSAVWLVMWLESVYLWFTLEPGAMATLPLSVLASLVGIAGILAGLLVLDRMDEWRAE